MTLKEIRESKGLTQAQVASGCKLSQQDISLYERGGRKPRYLTTLKELAKGYRCSIENIEEATREEI